VAAAWPLAVRAQQPERMRRIGYLSHRGPEHCDLLPGERAAFRSGGAGLDFSERPPAVPLSGSVFSYPYKAADPRI
jgi:hypothetical protein